MVHPRYAVERHWLHEQYVTKQGTFAEIAAEMNVSSATIGRLLHRHGIPARGRGGQSHRESLRAGDGLPEPLASAVRGPGGADRVRRFQVFGRTRSLNAAAKRLGIKQPNLLTDQLVKLEAACGGKLLNRLVRGERPQQVTDLGQALLEQADRHLGPNPMAPPTLPEPLAAILARHCGDKILARFIAATAFPTRKEAAIAFGIHPDTLLYTIRNIEASVGAPVLVDHHLSAPLRLTPIGHRLMRQADKHES
jgi:hypothetical protein